MATITVEANLGDFDDDAIIESFMDRKLYMELDHIDLDKIKVHHNLIEEDECECSITDFETNELLNELNDRGVRTNGDVETVRDEFYDDVLARLKEKYSVQELEKLL